MALTKCKECGSEVSNKAETCPKCGAKVKKSYGCGTLILVLIVLAVISNLFSAKTGQESNTPTVDPKQEALGKVKIKTYNWNKGGFDSIMMLNATIENLSGKDVKDIKITCDHSSNSGTKIDSNTKVIYETFKAGKTKKIHDFNMGFIHSQAAKTGCYIVDLVLL